MKQLNKDKIIGVGAIVFAMFFFHHTNSITYPDNLVDPGPRLLPYLAEGIMIICGIGMIIESELKKVEDKAYLSKSGWIKLGIIFGSIILYAVGLTYLGFNISTPFMSIALIHMLSEKNRVPILKNIIISIVVTVLISLVFTKGFGVMLPQGIF